MSAQEIPPPFALFRMITGYYVSRAIYVVADLGIADLARGRRARRRMAVATGDARAVAVPRAAAARQRRRVLRSDDGSFALTPLSGGCAATCPARFARPCGCSPDRRMARGASSPQRAHRRDGSCHVFGPSPFDYLEQHPEEGAIFDEAMAASRRTSPMRGRCRLRLLAVHTLVDVGGGNGALLAGILKANPHSHGVVFDLPRVAEGAAARSPPPASPIAARSSAATSSRRCPPAPTPTSSSTSSTTGTTTGRRAS